MRMKLTTYFGNGEENIQMNYKTIKQWRAIRKELLYRLRLAVARQRTARKRVYGTKRAACKECGSKMYTALTDEAWVKFDLETDLCSTLRAQMWNIGDWIITLEKYEKGEPNVNT